MAASSRSVVMPTSPKRPASVTRTRWPFLRATGASRRPEKSRFKVANSGGNPPGRLWPRATRRKNRKHSGADGSSITCSQWRSCAGIVPSSLHARSRARQSGAYSQQDARAVLLVGEREPRKRRPTRHTRRAVASTLRIRSSRLVRRLTSTTVAFKARVAYPARGGSLLYMNRIVLVSSVEQRMHSKVRRSWSGWSISSMRASPICTPHFAHTGR